MSEIERMIRELQAAGFKVTASEEPKLGEVLRHRDSNHRAVVTKVDEQSVHVVFVGEFQVKAYNPTTVWAYFQRTP